jgi:SAM-dependent methyltransferase
MADFYDNLAPYYHLIFQDWDSAIRRQADRLSAAIAQTWGEETRSVLDVSCGIGTQAIGLAQKGYAVTASDLSAGAIERARAEADSRGLQINFSVADMREAHAHHAAQFDLVICCDNSITHLLADEDILLALREMYACVRPGGGCLLTVREYEKEERGRGLIKPYGLREDGPKQYLLLQVWDFDGDEYDLSFYIVEDDRAADVQNVHVFRTRYYAIGTNRLLDLMRTAGFTDARRLDWDFYQPVLVGTKPTQPCHATDG